VSSPAPGDFRTTPGGDADLEGARAPGAGAVAPPADRALGLDRADGRLGLLYTAGAAGSLGASLLLPWLGRRIGPTRLTLVALTANLGALALALPLPSA
jgi:hypothetical protein